MGHWKINCFDESVPQRLYKEHFDPNKGIKVGFLSELQFKKKCSALIIA